MAICRRPPSLTGASNAGWVGRNREVQYIWPRQTSELMTLVAGERRSLFLTGDDSDVYDKKPQYVAPKTTEQHLIVCSGLDVTAAQIIETLISLMSIMPRSRERCVIVQAPTQWTFDSGPRSQFRLQQEVKNWKQFLPNRNLQCGHEHAGTRQHIHCSLDGAISLGVLHPHPGN